MPFLSDVKCDPDRQYHAANLRRVRLSDGFGWSPLRFGVWSGWLYAAAQRDVKKAKFLSARRIVTICAG